ncbi:MAG: DUF4430 domain-containing protein [Blautia sp.]|jgi:hypothetical protein
MKQKNSNKKIIIAAVIFVLVVAALFGVYQLNKGKTTAGDKSITVKVVHKDGASKDFNYETDREFLGDVLKDEKLVEGEDGQFGMFITTVDGETAKEAEQEWWCLTKGGEQVNTSADQAPIMDGDVYELTLTVGY